MEDSLDKFVKPHPKDTLTGHTPRPLSTNSIPSTQSSSRSVSMLDSRSISKKNVFFCEELNEFFPNDNPKDQTSKVNKKAVKSILKPPKQRKYNSEQRVDRSKLKNLFDLESDDEDDSDDEEDSSTPLRANQRFIHLVEFPEDDLEDDIKKKPLKMSVVAIEKVIPRKKTNPQQPNDAIQELKNSLETSISAAAKSGYNDSSVQEAEKNIEKKFKPDKISPTDDTDTSLKASKPGNEKPLVLKPFSPKESFESKFLPKNLICPQNAHSLFKFSDVKTSQSEINQQKTTESIKPEISKELVPGNSKSQTLEKGIFKINQLAKTEKDQYEDSGVLDRLRSRRDGGSQLLRNSSQLIIQNSLGCMSERQLEVKKSESTSKLFSFR